MDAQTVLRRLTRRAEAECWKDQEARRELNEALAEASPAELATTFEAALRAAARAEPWRQLMESIKRHGVREGLAQRKAAATEELLAYGLDMNTSLVAVAAVQARDDGLRRFLTAVGDITVDEHDTPADGEPADVPAGDVFSAAPAAPEANSARRG